MLAIGIGLPATALAANTISGHVTDSSTGHGIPNITVALETKASQTVISSVTTDGNGNYTLAPTADSATNVVEFNPASANPNYTDQFFNQETDFTSADAVDTTAGNQTNINALLDPVPGTLSGTVTDSQTHAGVSGIDVELLTVSDQVVDTQTTAADGTYTFTENPGTYIVEFAPDNENDYTTQFYNGATNFGGATGQTITGGTATANINASLTLAHAHVTGTVTDQSGAPLANIGVQALDANGQPVGSGAVTAANGTYALTDLPTGTVEVHFDGNGQNFVPQYYNGKSGLSTADAIAVTTGTTTAGINAKLAPGGTITGTLTNAAGTPLANAAVEIQNCTGFGFEFFGRDCTATTNASGVYTLTGLATGNYFLAFSEGTNTNLLTVYSGGVLNANQAAAVSVTAGASTNTGAALPTGGQITGTITNSSTGAPAAGVVVSALDANGNGAGSVATVANGTYTISSLRSGTYKLRIDGSPTLITEYYNGSSTLQNAAGISVTQGQTATVSVGVPPASAGGRISGTVLGPNGAPLAGADISIVDTAGNPVTSASSDTDGTYRSPALLPGSYKVEFSTGAGNLAFQYYSGKVTVASANVVAVSGGTTTSGINATLTAGGAMTGSVTDAATHTGLGGVRVNLVDATGAPLAGTTTLPDGSYVLTGVPTGSYHVQFDPTGSTATGGALYAVQYYSNKATLASSDPVTITAPGTTPNISAGLVTLAGVATPVTTVPTPVPTPTKPAPVAGKPTSSGAKLSGLGKRKASLKFTLAAGKNGAPKLKSLTVKLPKGLSFVKKGLKKGVKVTGGGKFTDKISKGALIVTLKGTASKVTVSLSSTALAVSKSLATSAKKGKIKTLTVSVIATDAKKLNTTTKLTFKKPK